jgi:very-short-patch-repair endonuclease
MSRKKLEHEYVAKFILDKYPKSTVHDTYKNSRTKLKITCGNGHIFEMNFNTISADHWCLACSYLNRDKTYTKNTIENIKKILKESHPGSKCIEKNDKKITGGDNINFICENNHDFVIKCRGFKEGAWCIKCFYINRRQNLLKNVQNFLDEHRIGSKCISSNNDYTDKILIFKCKNDHILKKGFQQIKNGEWCIKCKKINMRKEKTKEILKFLNENHKGSVLLSEYTKDKIKMDIICENKHNFSIDYHTIKQGVWCQKCSYKTRVHKNKKTLKDVVKYINKHHFGSKCLETEYKNKRTKMKFICENDHSYIATFGNITQGAWCCLCRNKCEKKVCEFLKGLNFDYSHQYFFKDIDIITRRPFDIYIESINTVIEIDGPQHFLTEKSPKYWRSNHEKNLKIDILKMRKIIKEKDCSIIRLSWKDIYRNNDDWKKFIKESLKYPEKHVKPSLYLNLDSGVLYNDHVNRLQEKIKSLRVHYV